jgi:hypothetical protein
MIANKHNPLGRTQLAGVQLGLASNKVYKECRNQLQDRHTQPLNQYQPHLLGPLLEVL